MQFPPAVWGPFFWHTIHIVALSYPKEPTYTDKRAAKEFYESLVFLLPCPTCREHYSAHLRAKPIATFLDSRADLFRWTVSIHNEVNKMLKKPEWREAEVIAYYERIGKRGRSPVWTAEDMKEVDTASFVRGFLVGLFGVGALAGGAWIAQKYLN